MVMQEHFAPEAWGYRAWPPAAPWAELVPPFSMEGDGVRIPKGQVRGQGRSQAPWRWCPTLANRSTEIDFSAKKWFP